MDLIYLIAGTADQKDFLIKKFDMYINSMILNIRVSWGRAMNIYSAMPP